MDFTLAGTYKKILPAFVCLFLSASCLQPRAQPVLEPGSQMTSPKDGMVLIYIPDGSFVMGSAASDQLDEKPEQQVDLDGFWIDQTEVTNGMYAACNADNACTLPSGTRSHNRDEYFGVAEFDRHPAIYISWGQATVYCQWAGRRLPTEAEWEKAARGTEAREYPWGNEPPNPDLLNFDRAIDDTTEVGTYPAGASFYGALDMAGNVSEWVSSVYSPYPFSAGDGREEPGSFESRVVRGGSWLDEAAVTRSAYRGSNGPSGSNDSIGFRCAMDASP